MKTNKKLTNYIENFIFPIYKNNDAGHNLEHIQYVINRSLKFANNVQNINYDMVFTIAAYHDIGHYINAKNHEKISADILFNDKNLKKFFNDEQIKIMAEAIQDHRASMNGIPRNIYGKIVSSADRNTSIEIILKRTYAYRIKHSPDETIDNIIEDSRQHIINKFGKNGYSKEKIYFEDIDYKIFLKKIIELTENKDKFKKIYMKINNIT